MMCLILRANHLLCAWRPRKLFAKSDDVVVAKLPRSRIEDKEAAVDRWQRIIDDDEEVVWVCMQASVMKGDDENNHALRKSWV